MNGRLPHSLVHLCAPWLFPGLPALEEIILQNNRTMLINLTCGGEQLHLDFKNHTEPLNVLILLFTFFCVLGNSVRGKQKEEILYPYLKKKKS